MGTKKHTIEEFLNRPFRDLKKKLKDKRRVNSSGTASKKDMPLSDDECFADAMKGVEEIREFRAIPVSEKAAGAPYHNSSSDRAALHALEEIVSGKRALHLPDTQEYVEWVNQKYRSDILERLHEGRYAVQDCLDLHGVFLQEAEEEVGQFLTASRKRGYKCIKIIHGRGLGSKKGPVLKDAVVKWLLRRYRKYIVAFVTARQCDGGLGALYILLI